MPRSRPLSLSPLLLVALALASCGDSGDTSLDQVSNTGTGGSGGATSGQGQQGGSSGNQGGQSGASTAGEAGAGQGGAGQAGAGQAGAGQTGAGQAGQAGAGQAGQAGAGQAGGGGASAGQAGQAGTGGPVACASDADAMKEIYLCFTNISGVICFPQESSSSSPDLTCYAPGQNGAPPSPCLPPDDPALLPLVDGNCPKILAITAGPRCQLVKDSSGFAPRCCYEASFTPPCPK